MARQIRWQVSFKSLNGTNCRVDIYEDGWSGGVTAVTPAANPFVFEEDDTDSLLDVIRVKTAYLRVKEEHYNDLYDLYPQTNTEHYVEAYYGYSIFFSGFMQAQSFEVPYEPGPRVLEFPISSPLGVLGGKYMPTPNSPSYVTLLEAIAQAASVMDANISSVVFPDEMITSAVLQNLNVNTLSYCPFNEDYDPAMYSTESIYKPKSVSSFIEAVCNCFGLIVHDMPGMLVFSRYDYTGAYYQYNLSSQTRQEITNGSGSRELDLSLLPSKSNQGKESTVLPIHKLTINYDDEMFPDYDLPFKRCKVQSAQTGSVIMRPMTDEISSSYLLTSAMPTPGTAGVTVGAIGDTQDYFGALEEMVVFSIPTNMAESTQFLKWKLYQVPKYFGYGCVLSFSIVGIDATTHETKSVKGGRIGIIMKNGNYYRQADGTWVITSAQYIDYQTSDENGEVKIEYHQRMPDMSKPLEVILCAGDQRGSYLFGIKDMRFSRTQLSFFSYVRQAKSTYTIETANGSVETAETGQTINVARYSEDALISNSGTPYQVIACTYDYMFQTQHRITLDVRTTPSVLHYLNKINIGNTVLKRITGFCFDFWNDRATIIAQGTTTL